MSLCLIATDDLLASMDIVFDIAFFLGLVTGVVLILFPIAMRVLTEAQIYKKSP